MKHFCHAKGCKVEVDPKFFMCPKHWRMVTPSSQRLIWAHYRPGQEIDKKPTSRYLEVARQVIEEVEKFEKERC